jgi:hypothetical protein
MELAYRTPGKIQVTIDNPGHHGKDELKKTDKGSKSSVYTFCISGIRMSIYFCRNEEIAGNSGEQLSAGGIGIKEQ